MAVTGRERLGWLVRKAWVKWASEQANPKDSWLVPWEELDEDQREVDMRIGEAVAADREAEIGRQHAHLLTLGREHARHALAISAHKGRADQQESRAIRAEKQLARFLSYTEEYDKLAEQAAESARNAAAADESRRAYEVMQAHVDWAQAELDKADARLAAVAAERDALEAELAKIKKLCRDPARAVGEAMGGKHVPGDRLAAAVLAIIGTEGDDRD